MTPYKPPALRGGKALAQERSRVVGIPVTPTTVNLAILAGGLLLGVAAYHYRNTPVGNILLGAAGSMAGVSFVFFINEALFGAIAPA